MHNLPLRLIKSVRSGITAAPAINFNPQSVESAEMETEARQSPFGSLMANNPRVIAISLFAGKFR